jgi:MFS family permease
MFLQYAPAGAVIPLFSLRLQELGFDPVEMGWACSTQSLGTLAAPLVAGQIADRWWPAERVMAVCGILAGLMLWWLAELTTPLAVFAAAFAFWLLLAPAMSLGVALSFAHLQQPARDFGRVRLWGTAGWIAISWLAGALLAPSGWLPRLLGLSDAPRQLSDVLRLGGVSAIALGAYALTLPHTPPQRTFSGWLAPIAALRSFHSRAMTIYALCVGGICVTLPFNSQVTPLFLRESGLSNDWIAPLLTLCQCTEILCLLFLPMFLTRLGIKGTLGLGLGAAATALVIMTVGMPLGLVVASLSLHGVCICCFFVAGQLFVNSRARPDIRASAQALIHFLIGFGMLAGHLLVGWVRDWADKAFRPTFLVSASLAVALLTLFILGFPGDEEAIDQYPNYQSDNTKQTGVV